MPAVTVADLNAVAKGWLAAGSPVILVNTPEKNRATVPTPADLLGLFASVKRADIAAYADTVSGDPLVPGWDKLAPAAIVAERRDSALGTREWTLANGVRVVLKPTDFKADELLLQGWSPGGVSLAPDSLLTSARFAAQVVNVSGIGAFSAVDLQKKLAGKAVGLSPFIGSYDQGVIGQASPRDAETLLQLAYLHFTAPRLDTEAVGGFFERLRAQLANRSASPQVAFQDTVGVTLAQHHPWSRPVSAAMVGEVRPREALDFYRARFANAAGFTFFLVGTFDPDSVRPLVQRYLGNLPARAGSGPERPRDPGIRPPEGVVQRTVLKGIEPKGQTMIVFKGTPPAPTARQDRFALSGLAAILEIRLREELREELGGTYSVSVNAGVARVPREEFTVSISFGSAPDRADTLVRAVFAQIDTLRATGPRAVDLGKVKETQIRSRETNLRQNSWWLQQLVEATRTGDRPVPPLEPLLAGLTADAVRASAMTFLDRSRYVRVTLRPEK